MFYSRWFLALFSLGAHQSKSTSERKRAFCHRLMYALNFTPLKVEKNRKRKVCASYNSDLYKILAETVLFTRNKIMEMHFRPIHILQYKVGPSRAAEVSRPLTFAETKRQKHLRGSCFYHILASLCVWINWLLWAENENSFLVYRRPPSISAIVRIHTVAGVQPFP